SPGKAARIGKPHRDAGHEHEGLGRIRETEIAGSQVLIDVSRNMIDENHHQRDTPKNIEAVIALPGEGKSISHSLLQLQLWTICPRGTSEAGKGSRTISGSSRQRA